MLRILHIGVLAALVLAAADVYKIKFDSTLQAEQVAKLRAEIRRERDEVAALRAEWTALDNPERIQALARRHLPLKPIDVTQFDNLDQLSDRPIDLVPPVDALGPMVDVDPPGERPTGSISAEAR
jgi:cell division protein FtsL